MNNSVREINGFYIKNIFYTDTDSLKNEKNYWDLLEKAILFWEDLCQSKNDYESRGFSYGFFLAPKKYCLTVYEFGFFQQNMIFKGFTDSKRLIDWSQYFKMLDGKNISAILPKRLKKLFINDVIIADKMGGFIQCNDKILHTTCNNQVIEDKDFAANLKLLKRQAPKKFGYCFLVLKKNYNYSFNCKYSKYKYSNKYMHPTSIFKIINFCWRIIETTFQCDLNIGSFNSFSPIQNKINRYGIIIIVWETKLITKKNLFLFVHLHYLHFYFQTTKQLMVYGERQSDISNLKLLFFNLSIELTFLHLRSPNSFLILVFC